MNVSSPLPLEIEEMSRSLVDSAFKVHRSLGPGLLESVYEACLCVELGRRGIRFKKQVAVPFKYEGVVNFNVVLFKQGVQRIIR